jgi:hypothetical protein
MSVFSLLRMAHGRWSLRASSPMHRPDLFATPSRFLVGKVHFLTSHPLLTSRDQFLNELDTLPLSCHKCIAPAFQLLRSKVRRVLLPRCPVIRPLASSISTPARAHNTGISDELMKRHPTRISRQQKKYSTSSRSF